MNTTLRLFRSLVACALLVAGASACAESAARERASAEFNCPGDSLQVSQIHETTYAVQGCNASAIYTCVASRSGGYTCVHDRWAPGGDS